MATRPGTIGDIAAKLLESPVDAEDLGDEAPEATTVDDENVSEKNGNKTTPMREVDSFLH